MNLLLLQLSTRHSTNFRGWLRCERSQALMSRVVHPVRRVDQVGLSTSTRLRNSSTYARQEGLGDTGGPCGDDGPGT